MFFTRYFMLTVLVGTSTWAVAQVQLRSAVSHSYTAVPSAVVKSSPSTAPTSTPFSSLYVQPTRTVGAVASGADLTVGQRTSVKANNKQAGARSVAKKASIAPVSGLLAKNATSRTKSKKPIAARKKTKAASHHSFRATLSNQSSDSSKLTNNPQSVLAHFASRLDVNDSVFRVPSLYLVVDEWLGTPYRYGRNDKKGTDCSGLVGKIFGNFFPDVLPRSASGMSAVIESKPIGELKEGDLVFFNCRGRKNSHVGLYLQNGWFIHASNVNGVTLNNLNSAYYRKLFSKGGPLKIGTFETLVHSGRPM